MCEKLDDYHQYPDESRTKTSHKNALISPGNDSWRNSREGKLDNPG
jgi:hypothetical protein